MWIRNCKKTNNSCIALWQNPDPDLIKLIFMFFNIYTNFTHALPDLLLTV
jgi:hypothetical protein